MELFFSLFVVEHVGLFPSGYAHPFIPNAIINAIAQIVHPEYVSHFLTDHFVIIRMKCGDDFGRWIGRMYMYLAICKE